MAGTFAGPNAGMEDPSLKLSKPDMITRATTPDWLTPHFPPARPDRLSAPGRTRAKRKAFLPECSTDDRA